MARTYTAADLEAAHLAFHRLADRPVTDPARRRAWATLEAVRAAIYTVGTQAAFDTRDPFAPTQLSF